MVIPLVSGVVLALYVLGCARAWKKISNIEDYEEAHTN